MTTDDRLVVEAKNVRIAKIAIAIFCVCSAALASLAAVGWYRGALQLAEFGADFVPMAPSTALLLLLFDFALLLYIRKKNGIHLRMARAMVWFATIVAFVILVLSLLSIQSGVEHPGLDIGDAVRQAPIGHMSPVTAAFFLMLGFSFLLTVAGRRAMAMAMSWLLLTGCAVFLLAYLYGMPLLYGGNAIPPALTTIIALLLLGAAATLLNSQIVNPARSISPVAFSHGHYLFFVFILLAAVIITAAMLTYRSYERKYREGVERQLASIAELKVDELEDWRLEQLHVASFFYQNEHFAIEVRRFLEPRDDAESRDTIETWLNKVESLNQISQVLLIDSKGGVRLVAPASSLAAFVPFSQETQNTLRAGNVALIDFHKDVDGTVRFEMAVPIIDTEDSNKPLGTLLVQIDPQAYIYPFINSWPAESETAETLLVRRDGDDVLFLNDLRFRKDSALTLRFPLTQKSLPAVQAVLGRKGIVEGVDYRGEPVIADVRPVPGTPWALVTRIDKSEVYAPLRQRLWVTVGLVIAALLAAGAGTRLIWQSQWALFYRERYEADQAIRLSEERYRVTLMSVGDGVIMSDVSGRVETMNATAEALTGWRLADARGKPVEEVFRILGEENRATAPNPVQRVLREGIVVGLANHTLLICRDGVERPIADSGAPIRASDGRITGVVLVFRDQTAQRAAERNQSLSHDVLEILNRKEGSGDAVREIVRIIKQRTGIEATGIRLREGEDFPYYETSGFSSEFVLKERYLCERDPYGRIIRDSNGKAYLDCMCGNVLAGRFDPALPFFTKAGSFWTNSTTKLLASTTDADRQTKTRNRCNEAGYESVALIPLKSGDETVGLLQLNDRRPNRFTPEMIQFFEGIGASVAVALSRKQTEERIQHLNRILVAIRNINQLIVREKNPDHLIRKSCEMLVRHRGYDGVFVVRTDKAGKPRKFEQAGYGETFEPLAKRMAEGHLPPCCLVNAENDGVNVISNIASQCGECPLAQPNASRGAMSIPLRHSSKLYGFMVVCMDKAVGVNHEERQLFKEVGEDIAYALSGIEKENALRHTEAEFRQAQKMEVVGKLAGGVAHDFNNILTGIIGYTDMALRQTEEKSPAADDLAEVRRLALRAADLTRQLLAFSRRQLLEQRIMNINTLIADTTKMLTRLLGEDIDLQFHPASNLANVRVDPGQIEQVLMNLAVNARDAMPQGGKLTIETQNAELDESYASQHVSVKPGHYVMLAVSDTGHGMDAATKERIFEPFFTTKEKGKGTGLGLATVYGIVKQHNGYIWVYSEPGKGASFKVYLPVCEDAVDEPSVGPVALDLRGSETILVVEDEPAVRRIVELALSESGYKVLTAANAREAQAIFEEHNSDIALLLTDLVLPGTDGKQLYELLKPRAPRLKVLFMSGYTDAGIVHQGVLRTGVAFMQKPFTAATVAQRVRRVLDGRRD